MAAKAAGTPNHPQRLKPSAPTSTSSKGWRYWTKRCFLVIGIIGLLGVAMIVYANVAAVWASRGKVFSDVSKVPETRVGLVFGTTDRVGGRENLYFRYRIEAATRLWKAGKLKTLIVSGDNREMSYNEPEKMRQALVERGIPASRIVCDYAGLRTLDSVVRAKEIFGVDSVVFISQRFQNERAIYLAKAHGIEAWGYDARDVVSHGGLKTKLREVGARVKMWLDVNLLHTGPKHLGEKVALPN
ncbi:MAG: YdcF family protein [Akkermansiaceae bacterium]|nr:YdcF family protein [Akkermansiaceae bacterium]